jgi:uncharacterized Rossmann fold enzyme
MFFTEWKPIYKKIVSDFSFSKDRDYQSAEILEFLLRQHPRTLKLSALTEMIQNKIVVVIGAGSQLISKINTHKKLIISNISIAADGATSAMLKQQMIPDIIVSDLDGNIHDQIRANMGGSIIVVHAHGDNIRIIQDIIPKIPNKIAGTIQIDPKGFSFVSNVGGFTDGDRAVFLANHFRAKNIFLIGFDFHGPIGEYSNIKNKDIQKKKKKLLWAEKLITMLNTQNNIKLID